MTYLQKRLTKLEGCFQPVMRTDPIREMQIEALVRLRPDELQLMERMAMRHELAVAESEAEQVVMAHYRESLMAVASERGMAA